MTNPSLVWLAGEASGDFIASLVMADIKRAYPEISMAGIGGPKMVASGLDAWYSSDLLSVRGYVEVLSKIPQLLWLRSTMARRVIREKPLAFIGVDAPDFNLGLELKLRSQSIKTIHLVCPAFWAWRANRIHTIAKAVDHMLCIFPFEKALLEKAHVPATYIGHPLASIIPEKPDKEAARARLGLNVEGPLFAVMPGSRQAEVKFCGPAFFRACEIVLGFDAKARFLVPAIDDKRRAEITKLIAGHEALEKAVIIVAGKSHDVLEASDAVLVASGTATLEAALFARPMVMGYRMPALSAFLIEGKGQTGFVSLPNILMGRRIVPELLQYYCTPKALGSALWTAYERREDVTLMNDFKAIYDGLKRDTGMLAAKAVAEVCGL